MNKTNCQADLRNRLRELLARRDGTALVMALVVSLLLIVLVTTTMSLSMIDAESINDYTRNRRTLQAADSGVEHGRIVLANSLDQWNLPAATTPDDVEEYADDAEFGSTANNQDISLVTDNGPDVGALLPRGDVKTSYTIDGGSSSTPTVGYETRYNLTPLSVERPEPGDISNRHVFTYQYEVISKGEAIIGGEENRATRVEKGTFSTEVLRPSFATYGYFTNSMKNQNNDQLWFYEGEVYGGHTHVNAAPPEGQAAFWGHSTFTGAFTAVQGDYNQSLLGGNASPDFQGGATWGVEQITLPPNGWSQLRAAIGDYANVDNNNNPTNAEIRTRLGLASNSDPVPSGVYYATGAGGTANAGTDLLGGIYIQGNTDSMQMTVDGDNQVITVVQGANTYVFRDNKATGTSTAALNGGTAKVFNKPLNGLIHVEGKVSALKGDGTANGADIEDQHALTLSVTGDIIVKDHITYQQNPVNNPEAKNILGIFSSNGNILLAKTAPSNLSMQATVMATGVNKGVGAEGIIKENGQYDSAYGNKGSWNLLGGLIENKNQTTGVFYGNGTVTGYTWNFTYDDRFEGGAAPPYFPYVTKFQMNTTGFEKDSWGRQYF